MSKELIGLLEDALSFDTQNPPGNELVLARYIAGYLADAPCRVEVQGLGGGRANVVAVLEGRSHEDALMLNGHLDTVPHGSSGWRTPPGKATLADGRLIARGASDMKSGLCAALYAFKRYCLSGLRPARDIIFAATAGEETDGIGAQALADAGYLDNVGGIVIGEPTGNKLGVCSKGAIWLRCDVTGRTSHAAYPEAGINAVTAAFELAGLVRGLLAGQMHRLLSEATCTVSQIQGGVKVNMVPDRCEIWLDIRTVPSVDHDMFLRRVHEKAAEMCARAEGCGIAVEVVNNRLPVLAQTDCFIARAVSESYRGVCGKEIEHTGTAFFSDASIFLRNKAIDTVLFGPGESAQAHKPNEGVELKDYEMSADVYYELLRGCRI